MNKDIYRIIDANFNRSREGLRVCEDISRFILNSESLTRQLKGVRHAVSNILKGLPVSRLPKGAGSIAYFRDAERDVGKSIRSRSEMKRADCRGIFTANIERVKESLRVLEEFFKLIDKKRAVSLSILRFKVYEIETRSIKKIMSLRNIR